MKYRIVKKTLAAGWTGFFIQRRVFFVWVSELRAVKDTSFTQLSFDTFQEAEEWILRQKKESNKVTYKEVIGEYTL